MSSAATSIVVMVDSISDIQCKSVGLRWGVVRWSGHPWEHPRPGLVLTSPLFDHSTTHHRHHHLSQLQGKQRQSLATFIYNLLSFQGLLQQRSSGQWAPFGLWSEVWLWGAIMIWADGFRGQALLTEGKEGQSKHCLMLWKLTPH